MSLTPEATPRPDAASPLEAAAVPRSMRRRLLRQRLWVVLLAIFAFEIGSFLLIYPWMDAWSLNHLPRFFPSHQIDLQDLWVDPYFRAAISCLGLLNVYIALREIVQLIRRSIQTK